MRRIFNTKFVYFLVILHYNMMKKSSPSVDFKLAMVYIFGLPFIL